jgi:hypothetical protein
MKEESQSLLQKRFGPSPEITLQHFITNEGKESQSLLQKWFGPSPEITLQDFNLIFGFICETLLISKESGI